MQIKKTILLFVVVGLIFLAYLYVSRGGGRSAQTLPSPTPIPKKSSYKSIVPGVSSMKDVVATLGQPIRQEGASLRNAFVYPSGLEEKPLFVYVDQVGAVQLIIEPVSENVRFSGLSAQLGSPDEVLYGRLQEVGYQLSVYAPAGVALLANPKTQSIKEQWYFSPMTVSEFMSTLATGFRTEPIPPQP